MPIVVCPTIGNSRHATTLMMGASWNLPPERVCATMKGEMFVPRKALKRSSSGDTNYA